jgi:hypothetical protein
LDLREEETGWRKLHNEELVLFTTFHYDDQMKEDMSRTCSMHEEMRNSYKNLVGNLEGLRIRLQDNIKVYRKEI